jgi:hypothetical protein
LIDQQHKTGSGTNLNTGEGGLLAILVDDERTSREVVIQHNSELEDLKILIANVLGKGDDPQARHGRDFVGGSRERNFKTTNGANRGLSVSADGRKAKSNKR